MYKKKLLLFSIIPLILLGLLAANAFKDSAAYYYTISEIKAQEILDKKLRIKGVLVEDSVNYDPSLPELRFMLTDDHFNLAATYYGVLPDNFHHANEIILEGKMNSDKEFIVSKLMLQCPSKYEGED